MNVRIDVAAATIWTLGLAIQAKGETSLLSVAACEKRLPKSGARGELSHRTIVRYFDALERFRVFDFQGRRRGFAGYCTIYPRRLPQAYWDAKMDRSTVHRAKAKLEKQGFSKYSKGVYVLNLDQLGQHDSWEKLVRSMLAWYKQKYRAEYANVDAISYEDVLEELKDDEFRLDVQPFKMLQLDICSREKY